jgi:erythromycin esterase-like protein
MAKSKILQVRVSAELAKRVEERLKETGENVSSVLGSALRAFAEDRSETDAVDVVGFDLLVGAQIALRKLADRTSSVEPGTPEAAAFLRDFRTLLDDLEKAKKRARRRVKIVLKNGAKKR